jgi:hypothetical protein
VKYFEYNDFLHQEIIYTGIDGSFHQQPNYLLLQKIQVAKAEGVELTGKILAGALKEYAEEDKSINLLLKKQLRSFATKGIHLQCSTGYL